VTAVTTTLWTCARCGVQQTTGGNTQPRSWVRAFFTNPPLGVDKQAIGDLCNPCGGYLVSFVHGTEVEDIARDAEVARVVREVDAEMLWRSGMSSPRCLVCPHPVNYHGSLGPRPAHSCDVCLIEIEAAGNLLAEALAEADPATVGSVLVEDAELEAEWLGDYTRPPEPVDVVRAALLADVEPMSFAGMALFILDALASAGFVVTLSERSHRAPDRSGAAVGVGTAAVPPTAPKVHELTPGVAHFWSFTGAGACSCGYSYDVEVGP